MWSEIDSVSRRVFVAAIIDWARHLNDWGIVVRRSELEALRREYRRDRAVLYRAVQWSIDRGCERLTLAPRDAEIARLSRRVAILHAASQVRRAA